MSDYWKLNIKDYTISELNNLFNLETPYTLEDIINADNDISEKIRVDETIDLQLYNDMRIDKYVYFK